VRLLLVFVRHELTTQLRSARFYGVTLAYLIASMAPVVIAYFAVRRGSTFLGAAFYGELLDAIQPLATTFFAAVIAVDLVVRERDESSLGVVSLAPVSATGYIVRRWLALVVLLVPITLVPRAVAIAADAVTQSGRLDAAPLLLGWLVNVLPLLMVMTALAMALGTITGNTVLALIAGFGLFTFGFGIANDLLAYAHHQVEAPAEFFGLTQGFMQWARWSVYDVSYPSAAGYPLARQLDLLFIAGALALVPTSVFAGIACSYLRRTKRDLRPWRIHESHQFRSFLRLMNRIREAYAPDGGLEIPERIALILGLLIAAGTLMMTTRRHHEFERLAAERYAAETTGAAPMPATIVPLAASLRGRVTRGGVLEATATFTLRNDGTSAQRELAFALNRGIGIERVTVSHGNARLGRVWERVGIALDPPLAPRQSRTVTFVLRGAPGTFDFSLPYGETFGARWRRYTNAKTSLDLADLSWSSVIRAATAERMLLSGPSLLPVPRYSPWDVAGGVRTWRHTELPENAFTRDAVTPQTTLSVDLDVSDDFLAIDSCGTASAGHLSSRCTFSLGDYVLLATRLETTTLAGGARLAYLPAHAVLARSHAPSLAAAIRLAGRSWPSFALHPRAIFAERPSLPDETYYGDWLPSAAMRALSARGALYLIPEPMFIRRKPINPAVVAAGLISGQLGARRPVVPSEQAFFRIFYETIATWRSGGRRVNAIEPPIGGRPITDPIVASAGDGRDSLRLSRVLSDVEYRVGAERLVEGIEDFVSAGSRPGTAKELLETIGRRGGVSLDRVYSDYFIGTALPKLTLSGVTFTRAGDAWEARGILKNEGEGEVFCPLVLHTAIGSVQTTVRVDTHGSMPFVLRTQQLPRTLQLDPQRVVYRHAAVGTVDFVDYQESR
jgi:ABC-type transport system involved in multi-copper enzyme maturation permease subunit